MLSPNKVALIDALNGNQPITYREWNQQTNRLANFFRDALPKTAANKVDKQGLTHTYGS
jgi:non-ribosomal peptide synthetase component E (peptide arylation enzyme)